MDEELQRSTKRWIERNLGYRYELLTDDVARTFVRQKFARRPDIVKTYERIVDPILGGDYIRYLAILSDGGVHSDVDVDCIKSIDE